MALTNRWSVLALLFAVRTSMGFQFQGVAALAPLFMHDYQAGIADIGFLIGIYLAPGIVLALPGGAIGRRFGDKSVVLAGLILMCCGALVMTLAPSWGWLVVGRVVAGIGGVLLNVLMSKMVTDWFAGREIATAMAIFVNSWPFGIALGLLAYPLVAARSDLAGAMALAVGLIGIGALCFARLYRAPAATSAGTGSGASPKGRVLLAVVTAGVIWGLFNASLGMVFGFGPAMLVERGWSVAAASSATSIVLWLAVISVPLGGLLADWTGRRDAVLLGGLLANAVVLTIASRTQAVMPAFVALGLVSGISAGPIMSLPAQVLKPETRAVGMGIFFALFYLLIVLGPWLGGLLANSLGSARVTFDLGVAMLVACCVALWLFRRLVEAPSGAAISA